MREQDEIQSSALQHPATDDRMVWQAYWRVLGQPWRTEPEIKKERQEELIKRRRIEPDIEQGIYPFKNMQLSRADIEWLLATYEDGCGPMERRDESQREREGLDLRGANLREMNLRGLPLACIQAGLTPNEWLFATAEQREMAAVHLEKASLSETHLERANLRGAYLKEANFGSAHLERAILSEADLGQAVIFRAHLEEANLHLAHLEKAILIEANLKMADLSLAYLERANLFRAHLEGANLRRVHLEDASLFETHLENADLFKAHLQRASLFRADLEGADLREVHLEGTDLRFAHLGGKLITDADLGYVEKMLLPADLRGAFLDATTSLENVTLGEMKFGFVSLADVHWGSADLTVVDWGRVKVLGDERAARQWKGKDGRKKDKFKRLSQYQSAVRANRQLAAALRDQGLSEESDYFAYRSQQLERVVLRRQRKFGKYLFSGFLDFLAGYGYRPRRSVFWYLIIIFGFAITYFAFGHVTPLEAFVLSLTSFHGRGFFPGTNLSLSDPRVVLAAFEAVIGLLIEISFIATFTQRFFGK